MKNLMLVDDHKIVRDGIKYYIESEEGLQVTGEADNGEKALVLLKKENFDLIITDISMPVMDGLKMMEKICQEYPSQNVLVLTMIDEYRYIKQMLSFGVKSFLLKNSSKDELLLAINKSLKGETYYSAEVIQIIINSLSNRKMNGNERLTLEASLTVREKEVLKLIVKEYTNNQIADELFISIRTVDSHKHNLLEKTGSKTLAGLVIYAIEHDIN
ncbi:MAG: DNA-binding NarL/FixJ family response regulator [Marinoscillum sp.]|jgi:DNA-binding NarL/FixJ family response regulator